jgi:hypothetical protein
MPVESDDDRAIFLSVDDFGVSATFTRGASVTTISGIFDNDFIEVDAGGTIPIAMQQPTFLARTLDVAAAVEDDTLLDLWHDLQN